MKEKTAEERSAEMKKRRELTCKHFNGLRNEACDLDIEYKTVTDYPESRANEAPFFQKTVACFGFDDAECSITCSKREFYTPEEIEAKAAASLERLRQYSEDYKNDICPNHKIPMVKKQIGRCIYADPCGCRLGQGKLPKSYKPKMENVL